MRPCSLGIARPRRPPDCIRGVELPHKQLYAVCRNFSETLDSLSVLAASDSQDCSAELVEEMRSMLVAYLAMYLD
jgi:hypothetical protein